jgi:hypothetical protein
MERRWHHRSETDIPATLLLGSEPGPVPCRIKNVSSSGLFVETAAHLVRNQFVQIRIQPQGAAARFIDGMVVHLKDGGVGIETENRSWSHALDRG